MKKEFEKAIIEINDLRASKLTSKFRLNDSVYYVIWDYLIFPSWREL